ncbi:MAG: hypothetical protein GY725_20345 [bacterium]|nr:hypothetical protein [bacterium]
MTRMSSVLVLCALSSILAACSNPSTPAGYEGYVFEQPRFFGKGGFRGVVKGPANYGVSLFRNSIINVDLRPRTYTEEFKILAKDDLNIGFRFHAIVSVSENSVEDVILKYGGLEWYERFAREPFRTFVREAVQQYDSREVKAHRSKVADEVRQRLEHHLKGSPFRLVSLVVGNINYPTSVAAAVEAKLAASQLLEEKATQKLIAQRDAEIRVEEAKGIAEAQRIINTTLSRNYLQHEAIQAQLKMAESPNHTTVYIPAGNNGIPMVYSPN